MREGSIGGGQREEQEQPDLPTEEELEEGIRAVQAAVAAAEHEEALHQRSEPMQDSYDPSGSCSTPHALVGDKSYQSVCCRRAGLKLYS